MLQDVLFYVLSDDVERSKQKLSKANPNRAYNIVFPGLGDNFAPGRENISLFNYKNYISE
jgi:hypothetical protein